jgi:putative ABC transport system permease protein
VAHAVQFIFLFTLVAGAIVLVAALLVAFDERRYELAVARALGATRRQLRQALLVELAAVGGIAGLIAGGGAASFGQVLARQVFQLDLAPDLLLLPVSAAAGAALATTVGWIAARHMLSAPAMLALRAGA